MLILSGPASAVITVIKDFFVNSERKSERMQLMPPCYTVIIINTDENIDV
jgi:hypothetical protein